MNSTRTDEHRPSAINPADYAFLAFEVVRGAFQGDLEACEYMNYQREIIRQHMADTGGTYSNHAHGGNCMVCGNANAIYTILFYHAKSNSYVRMGEDCAYKVEASYGDMNAFRRAVKSALLAVAGKKKAQAFLVAEDLERAWELYTQYADACKNQTGGEVWNAWKYEERTLNDMVSKLVQYGSLSEKQVNFMRSLVARMPERARIQREREAEKAAAADCPTGRVTVAGKVLKTDTRETAFGMAKKMLVKDSTGFLVWVTSPSKYSINRGDFVKFVVTLTPSKDDPKFGFGKRPVVLDHKPADSPESAGAASTEKGTLAL